MTNEIAFIEKVVNMINGELKQLERMLEMMKSDEIQTAYLRGERTRLVQMKLVMEERKTELQESNVNTGSLVDW